MPRKMRRYSNKKKSPTMFIFLLFIIAGLIFALFFQLATNRQESNVKTVKSNAQYFYEYCEFVFYNSGINGFGIDGTDTSEIVQYYPDGIYYSDSPTKNEPFSYNNFFINNSGIMSFDFYQYISGNVYKISCVSGIFTNAEKYEKIK